jgi:hypothetical protein
VRIFRIRDAESGGAVMMTALLLGGAAFVVAFVLDVLRAL